MKTEKKNFHGKKNFYQINFISIILDNDGIDLNYVFRIFLCRNKKN